MASLRNKKSDQKGQATTEYILMLTVMVGLTVLVMKKAIGPVFTMLGTAVNSTVQKRLMAADLHSFPMGSRN